ncbi:MraW methylase family protein [Besnoitia besnoiti]|uniref:MraW methylase family protein n=1 Tax=Besnoitia besnoiti TaxID=94643 RepID=A0A2A9MEP6_BESBE|nr:MraW methylase family protein [Besnoitia besnoiti]PFH36988.1 MraW methylase family protein [Besnoitia besnoiti]
MHCHNRFHSLAQSKENICSASSYRAQHPLSPPLCFFLEPTAPARAAGGEKQRFYYAAHANGRPWLAWLSSSTWVRMGACPPSYMGEFFCKKRAGCFRPRRPGALCRRQVSGVTPCRLLQAALETESVFSAAPSRSRLFARAGRRESLECGSFRGSEALETAVEAPTVDTEALTGSTPRLLGVAGGSREGKVVGLRHSASDEEDAQAESCGGDEPERGRVSGALGAAASSSAASPGAAPCRAGIGGGERRAAEVAAPLESDAPRPPAAYHTHVPVMLEEVLQYLVTAKNGVYVDCTAGGGGHTAAVWERVAPEGGKVLAIDMDAEAVSATRERMQRLYQAAGDGRQSRRANLGEREALEKEAEPQEGRGGASVCVSTGETWTREAKVLEKTDVATVGSQHASDAPGTRPASAQPLAAVVLQSSFANLPEALGRARGIWDAGGIEKSFLRRVSNPQGERIKKNSAGSSQPAEGDKTADCGARAGQSVETGADRSCCTLDGRQESKGDSPPGIAEPKRGAREAGAALAADVYEGLRGTVDGILADLGVSTHQLSAAHRGFSHTLAGPLDMRFGQTPSDSFTESADASASGFPRSAIDAGTAPHALCKGETAGKGDATINARRLAASGGESNSPTHFNVLDSSTTAGKTGLDAAQVVNGLPQAALASILRVYGEESLAGPIASCIVRHREAHGTLRTTEDLRKIVEGCCRYRNPKFVVKTCSRVFQALRIYVNREMEALEKLLTHAEHLLKPGGRLVILSYHSLEDRIIKNRLKQGRQEAGCSAADFGREAPLSALPLERPNMARIAGRERNAHVHQDLPPLLETFLSSVHCSQEVAKLGNALNLHDTRRALFGSPDRKNKSEGKLWRLVLKKPVRAKDDEVLRNRR